MWFLESFVIVDLKIKVQHSAFRTVDIYPNEIIIFCPSIGGNIEAVKVIILD